MDVKKVLYGTGMTGALAGAFLAGSVALRPVFAQNAPAPGAGVSQQDERGRNAVGEQREAGERGGDERRGAEQDEAAEAAALQAQATITLEQAKQAALAQFPGGSVLDAELEDENGAVVYGVEVRDAKGAEHDVKVDAKTGAVVATQAEGHEGPESESDAD